MVARRIRISLEHWDRTEVDFQEQIIGRHKYSGAPLGKAKERDPLDLDRQDKDGNPVIADNSHVRPVHHAYRRRHFCLSGRHWQRRILRAAIVLEWARRQTPGKCLRLCSKTNNQGDGLIEPYRDAFCYSSGRGIVATILS
jgi:Dyp-type peroxidase family